MHGGAVIDERRDWDVKTKPAVATVAAVAALAGGCAHSSAPGEAGNDGSQPVTLHVFAAASLTESFAQLEKDFEAAHPNVDVVVSYAGSQDLVAQMQAGAPADVFASASQTWMDRAASEGLTDGDPVVFARNSLQLAVAPGNPKNVTGLEDVAERDELVTVRCAAAVPCGALTDKVLDAESASVSFDTEQNSVTDTLGLVTAGEADVAFVYTTDVTAARGKADGVDIAGADSIATTYPIASTSLSRVESRDEVARQFVEYVAGAQGQKVLAGAGFETGEQ